MWVHYSHIKIIGGAVAPPAPPVPTPLLRMMNDSPICCSYCSKTRCQCILYNTLIISNVSKT